MKNKAIKLSVISVLIIAIISLSIILLKDEKEQAPEEIPKKDLPLAGEKIKDVIYKYTYKKTNRPEDSKDNDDYLYSIEVQVYDDDIYFLEHRPSLTVLKKLNIHDTKPETIAEKKLDVYSSYCFLNEEYKEIGCYSDDEEILYDEKLNKEFVSNYGHAMDAPKKNLVHYQDGTYDAWEVKGINSDKVDYFDHIYTKDNTFILYNQRNLSKMIIYDVKNKKKYNEQNKGYQLSSKEVAFIKDNSVKFYNIEKNTIEEYPFKSNFYYQLSSYSALNPTNSMLAFYSVDDKTITVEDAKNKKRLIIDLSEITDKSLANMYFVDDYLYILEDHYSYTDEDVTIYLIDLKNRQFTDVPEENSSKVPTPNSNQEIENKLKILKNDFNINVHIKEDAKTLSYDYYDLEYEDDDKKIITYLDALIDVAQRHNKEFFDTFYDVGMEGLNIYLIGNIIVKNENDVDPAAYAVTYMDKHLIVFDITINYDIKPRICHELMHSIETNYNFNYEKADNLFEKWNDYNPKGFQYSMSYYYEPNTPYVIGNNKGLPYFVSSYAKTDPREDRADMYRHICMGDSYGLNHENIAKKAYYLRDELVRGYPMLRDAKALAILN